MPSAVNVDCHKYALNAECHYAECHSADSLNARCWLLRAATVAVSYLGKMTQRRHDIEPNDIEHNKQCDIRQK
jgi:hypothetical protein